MTASSGPTASPHLRRLQVRVGMGHGPGQRRRHRLGLRGRHAWTARPRPTWSSTSGTCSRATSDGTSRPCRGTTCRKIPVEGPCRRTGLPARRIAKVPVPGAFKFESVTPGTEIRLVRNDNYTNPGTGKPAHLDALVFKWYGDADAMIAGYKSGDFDIATDLKDSDLPRSRTWATRSRRSTRSPTSSSARTGPTRRVQQGQSRLLARTHQGPRHRLPDGRPGDPRGGPLGRQQGRDQHPAPRRRGRGRQHLRLPGRLVLHRPAADTLRPGEGEAILDAAAGSPRRRRHPRQGRPQGEDRALHDDPPGPPGHAGPGVAG